MSNHATSYAEQLCTDLQALQPFLEGVPDEESTIGKLFEDDSTLRLELANFDFVMMRHQTLASEWSPPPRTQAPFMQRLDGLLDVNSAIGHPFHTVRGPLAEPSWRSYQNEPPPEL